MLTGVAPGEAYSVFDSLSYLSGRMLGFVARRRKCEIADLVY